MILNRPFDWVQTLPGLKPRERHVVITFHVCAIALFLFMIRWGLYAVVPGSIYLEKALKVVVYGSFVILLLQILSSGIFRPSLSGPAGRMFAIGLVLISYATILSVFVGFEYIQDLLQKTFYYLMMISALVVGARGSYFHKTAWHYLIMFYFTVVLMMFTFHINVTTFDAGAAVDVIDEFRNTTSLAYYFRSILVSAPFFFFLGIYWKRPINIVYRLGLLGAIVPYVYYNCLVFKFRAVLALLAISGVLAFLRSIGRLKVWSIVLIVILGLAGTSVFLGKGAEAYRERVEATAENTKDTSVFEFIKGERWDEAEAMLNSMSPASMLTGKGLVATFDASEVLGEKAYEWSGGHLGFLPPLLFGGVFFMLWHFLVYFMPIFRSMTCFVNDDGFVLACRDYAIVELCHYLVCPFALTFTTSIIMIPLWCALGTLLSKKYWPPFNMVQRYAYR